MPDYLFVTSIANFKIISRFVLIVKFIFFYCNVNTSVQMQKNCEDILGGLTPLVNIICAMIYTIGGFYNGK